MSDTFVDKRHTLYYIEQMECSFRIQQTMENFNNEEKN